MAAILDGARRAAGGQWAQREAARAANLKAQAVNDSAPVGPFAEMISAALCCDAAAAGDWTEALAHARAVASRRSHAALPLVVPLRWPDTAAGMGLPGELWPICAALRQMGRAEAIVRALAEKIEDEALRAGFVAGAAAQLKRYVK
jgi:hypothetical protein